MQSEIFEIGKVLSEEEAAKMVKDSFTVDVLRSLRLLGIGIPSYRDGMGFIRYNPADVRKWIESNFPQQ